MKIVYFITSIDVKSGGTTTYLKLLVDRLKSNAEIIVVTGISDNPVHLDGVNVMFLNLSINRFISHISEFKFILQNEKPDYVHINGIWQPQCALFQYIAQFYGIKVIVSPHGMLEPYILSRHPLKKKIAMFLYQHKAIANADILHATAVSEKNQFEKLGFTNECFVIPNGIDLSPICKKSVWHPIRKILFLSRIHPKKGIEVLIQAISNLRRNDIQLTIAGEGEFEYVKYLQNYTKELQLERQIIFLGGVYGAAKWQLYQESDLFVLPTYSENFGIVIAEALATGLPVITTSGAPWGELIEYNCGWWIDNGVEQLENALLSSLDKRAAEIEIMGRNGINLITSKYSIESIVDKFLELYKS